MNPTKQSKTMQSDIKMNNDDRITHAHRLAQFDSYRNFRYPIQNQDCEPNIVVLCTQYHKDIHNRCPNNQCNVYLCTDFNGNKVLLLHNRITPLPVVKNIVGNNLQIPTGHCGINSSIGDSLKWYVSSGYGIRSDGKISTWDLPTNKLLSYEKIDDNIL